MISDALVVSQFSDDVNILLHALDVSKLDHFEGVHIPVAPEKGRVDVLIGESGKFLLTVLDEREGAELCSGGPELCSHTTGAHRK